jgi:DNA-directed RNA polymerase subunit omega
MREGLIHAMQVNVEVDEVEAAAAPVLALEPQLRLGCDDPSVDSKIDVMTEDALLRAMKSLIPDEPNHQDIGTAERVRSSRAERAFGYLDEK